MDSGLLSMMFQSMLALAFVLGLFALLVWGMRRFQGGIIGRPAGQDFRVIKRIHLDNKHSLVEVSHEGQRYLIGLSQGGMIQLRPDQALPDRSLPETPTPKESSSHEA